MAKDVPACPPLAALGSVAAVAGGASVPSVPGSVVRPHGKPACVTSSVDVLSHFSGRRNSTPDGETLKRKRPASTAPRIGAGHEDPVPTADDAEVLGDVHGADGRSFGGGPECRPGPSARVVLTALRVRFAAPGRGPWSA